MRADILGVSALALCLAGGFGALYAADTPAVTIAVLRGDGVLIPIVTRAGTKWAHTWPVPAKAAEVPLGLDGIPKRWWGKRGPATRWHAWQIDGNTADVVVERPTWYLAHCQQGVGLRTPLTARPPLPPPTTQPYPKLGLASSAPVTFLRINPVDQSDRMWMAVTEKVHASMLKAESDMDGRMVANEGPRARHPIPGPERAKVSTRVETLYRLPLTGGRVVYYVEATRRYGMPPMAADTAAKAPTPRRGCSVMSFGSGFFAVDANGVIPTPTLTVHQSSCDYDNVRLMLPLAAIDDGRGSPVWIGQLTSWNDESYHVLRWDAEHSTMVNEFATHGGTCASDDGG